MQNWSPKWVEEGKLNKHLFWFESQHQWYRPVLLDKIEKKLKYWCLVHLTSTGEAAVVNQVLLSILWFFISIWTGLTKLLSLIRYKLVPFLWASLQTPTYTGINWNDCCASRKVGGLGLTDRYEALAALLSKWMVQAYLPGESSLPIIEAQAPRHCSCLQQLFPIIRENRDKKLGASYTRVGIR